MHKDSVSCLMVTANRPQYVARAIALFEMQTYENKELVIIDDGESDLSQLVENSSMQDRIRYHRLNPLGQLSLGELRNISVEAANGEWCIQWDDDEWYHPQRIERQLHEATTAGLGSSALKWTLMHIDSSDQLKDRLFRVDTGIATPGTLLFKRSCGLLYHPLARNEDGIFMREIREKLGLAVLGRSDSHLFVRVFHGQNTWDLNHFLRRLHRKPSDWPSWFYALHMRSDISKHRAFSLTKPEAATANAYLDYVRSENLENAQ